MKNLVFALALACVHFAFGGVCTWSGGGEAGKWSDPANWQGGGCPGAGDVAVFACNAEITENVAIAEGTLTISNAIGTALHFKGVISGAGGIFKGGDGSLHLHCGNTFAGGLVSCGTGDYKENTSATLSSCVYVYADDALGAGPAQFDPVGVVGTASGHGALLYCCGKESLEISVPVTLSGDQSSKGNVRLENGCKSLRFKDFVQSPFRILVSSPYAVSVTFDKGYSSTNYNIFEKGEVHIKGPVNAVLHPYSGVAVHLYSTGNAYSYFYVGGATYLYAENALAQNGGYIEFPNANSRIDLNGFDQTIVSMSKAFVQKPTVCTFGFTSPDDSPAMLRLIGSVPPHPDFRGLFQGSAGLEWGPDDASEEFCFSNTVQTTCGEFAVSGGAMRFRSGAGFDRLKKLTVKSGAKFAAESTAGILEVAELVVEEGATLELGNGIVLVCGSLKVSDEQYRQAGLYGSAELPAVVSGGGAIRLAPRINRWIGGDGNWSDAANWSQGSVPSENEDVSVAAAKRIVLDMATPRLFSFNMNSGATLVFSNGWDVCLWADDIVISDSTVTLAGAFTNETDKCRVYFRCGNFTLASSGRIDADGKGWRGGGYVQLAGVSNPGEEIVNSSGIKWGGFGPGAANTTIGASHFGYGAPNVTRGRVYDSKISRLYDDPYAPCEPGSGGFGITQSAYGCVFDPKSIPSGGGAVFIDAGGAVVLNGTVSACGIGSYVGHAHYCNYPYCESTGGSGGSVRIRCETVSGGGEIRADGGNGGFSVPSYRYNPRANSSTGAPGGGGGIAIEYDTAKQVAGAVAGMKISAAAGIYPEMPLTGAANPQTEPLAYAKMDKYRRDAEPGTLYFSDRKLIDDTIGKGLSGKLFSVDDYVYEGDLDWSYGNVRFGATGAVFAVNGNLTVTGEWSRIDIGGITMATNFGTRPYIHSGTVPVRLTVNGDLVVSNGAALAVYAARVDGETVPGARVEVAGAFVVGNGGTVLPTSDYGHGGAPAFTAGSFVLAEGGRVDADHRGYSGAWNNADYDAKNGGYGQNSKGCGPGAGDKHGAGAGHGGIGGQGQWNDSPTGSDNGGVYGDAYWPVRSGSGGGSGGDTWAGDGGGVFCLEAVGSVKLAGTVSANGSFHEYGIHFDRHHYAGCGSGGSVLISGAIVESTETALVSARGGDAPMMQSARVSAGCGGGGRVAIWTGRDIELRSAKPRKIHSQDPASEKFGGTLVWAGTVDVGSGTNIVLRTDADAPAVEQLPTSYGGAGTVWFNRFAPQGLGVIVR